MKNDASNLTTRMTTGVERVFRPTPDSNIFQEVLLIFLHYMDSEGNKVRSVLQKQDVTGKLYRVIGPGEEHLRSMNGEVEYEFPHDGVVRRMVALGMTYQDMFYGRGMAPQNPGKWEVYK